MFFSREVVKSLRERPAVKEYLERENLRLDNLDSVSEIVKETRAGIVFNTLIPKYSAIMKHCTKGVNFEYVEGELKTAESNFNNYFKEYRKNYEFPASMKNDIMLLSNRRTNERVGFAISEFEECDDHPDTDALKVICAIKGYGDLLLYSYLYCAKKQRKKYGLLELAGGFSNLSGLCSYNKFGFREDMSMKNNDCFPEYGTLPMKVELSKLSYEDLDDVLRSRVDPVLKEKLNKQLEKDDTSEPLCNKYFVKHPANQKKLVKERINTHNKFSSDVDSETMKKESDDLKKKQLEFLKNALSGNQPSRVRTRASKRQLEEAIAKKSKSRSVSKSRSRSKSRSASKSRGRSTAKKLKVSHPLSSSLNKPRSGVARYVYEKFTPAKKLMKVVKKAKKSFTKKLRKSIMV